MLSNQCYGLGMVSGFWCLVSDCGHVLAGGGGLCPRHLARRLADGRVGGGHRHFCRDQFLAVLHGYSMSCFSLAIPGNSCILIRSSAYSRCASGRMPFLFAGVLDVLGGLALGLGLRPKRK